MESSQSWFDYLKEQQKLGCPYPGKVLFASTKIGSLLGGLGQYFDLSELAQYNPKPTRERTPKELSRFIMGCSYQGLVRK